MSDEKGNFFLNRPATVTVAALLNKTRIKTHGTAGKTFLKG